MTREQMIVLGFFVAAFVAGWLARALIGRRDRQHAVGQEERAPAPVLDERIDRALDASREQLDRAIRSYVSNLVFSLTGRAAPDGARPDGLVDEVSAALQDDAANESMLSVVDGEDGASLSERELDLTDWGFAYGVAWAQARERHPTEPDAAIADEALRAAENVFRAYAAEADWNNEDPSAVASGNPSERPRNENGRGRWLRARR